MRRVARCPHPLVGLVGTRFKQEFLAARAGTGGTHMEAPWSKLLKFIRPRGTEPRVLVHASRGASWYCQRALCFDSEGRSVTSPPVLEHFRSPRYIQPGFLLPQGCELNSSKPGGSHIASLHYVARLNVGRDNRESGLCNSCVVESYLLFDTWRWHKSRRTQRRVTVACARDHRLLALL